MTKRKLTRRTLLRGAGTVAGAVAVHPLLSSDARASGGYDPAQRFVRLVPGGGGVIYGVQSSGELMWYRHTDRLTGGGSWANGGTGRQIGTDWQQFKNVLASSDGQIFALRGDGTLLWYRYVLTDGTTGAGYWAAGSGSTIGSGFDVYPRVFGGWGGVIYCVDQNGNLFWYRYMAGTGAGGAAAWANSGIGSRIGWGWKPFIKLWAAPNGVIFGARQGQPLYWWKYLGTSGEVAWANGGTAIHIGDGWGDEVQKEWLANGDGTIYVIALDWEAVVGNDDRLVWYRLLNSETVDATGSANWYDTSGRVVGTGFSLERSAALQGYGSRMSVASGGSIAFSVSTTFPSYRTSIIKLAGVGGATPTVWGPTDRTGGLQRLGTGYRENGCAWASDVSVPIPSSWGSGVYAAKLEIPAYGLRHYVPFVVKPTAPSANVAFLLPTNTYQAYNTWGGHNHYTPGGLAPRTFSFRRPSAWSAEVEPTGTISHMLGTDLILLRWLAEQSISVDCYQDADLHESGAWLTGYKALVLASHPEYWSDQMRQSVDAYTRNGGRLIYTGGNGLYERVTFPTDHQLNFFDYGPGGPTSGRDVFSAYGKPESQVLGVNLGPGYMTFDRYEVRNVHPFLTGTGLSVGSTFGAVAYNGAASGWGVDNTPGGIPGLTVIAHGRNSDGGADMVYVDKGNGGWVFSAGSISFNGGLLSDSKMSRLLLNVFTAAVAP